MTLDDSKNLEIALALLQEALIIITNVDIAQCKANFIWSNQTQTWIDSAVNWRDNYFELLEEINK